MWCFNIINLWISLTWNLFSMGHSQSFQTKFRSMKVFQLVQLSWEKHVFFFKLWVEMLNTTATLQVSRKCCSCICFSYQVFSEVQVVQKQLYNREIKLTFDNAWISRKIKKNIACFTCITFPNNGLFSPSQNPIACLDLPKQIVSS